MQALEASGTRGVVGWHLDGIIGHDEPIVILVAGEPDADLLASISEIMGTIPFRVEPTQPDQDVFFGGRAS
jgi:hypothetical protein